ncbi:helix-turn-helix domain-containing protein [Comamonas sp. MYb396]|uniref:helix-turn-helix domain-containing protein n=1 Tax=Comamonas sp. MYb396 TaxID=2745302 RepID=UPI0030B73C05
MKNTHATQEKPDWERIELDYRAGIKSLREIADGSGVSHVTISKHAKRNGWVRDLSAKIQAKADDLVNRASVNKPVNSASAVSEREMVDGVAKERASVQLAHRKDIGRARKLTNALLDELEGQTDPATLELLDQLGELLYKPDDKGRDKLNDLYQAVISLPERSKTMKVLAESLAKLVDLERTAFGMDSKELVGVAARAGARIAVEFVKPGPVEDDDD